MRNGNKNKHKLLKSIELPTQKHISRRLVKSIVKIDKIQGEFETITKMLNETETAKELWRSKQIKKQIKQLRNRFGTKH